MGGEEVRDGDEIAEQADSKVIIGEAGEKEVSERLARHGLTISILSELASKLAGAKIKTTRFYEEDADLPLQAEQAIFPPEELVVDASEVEVDLRDY